MIVSAFVLIKMVNECHFSDNQGITFKKMLKEINEIESVYILDLNNSPYDVIAKINTDSINSLYNIIQKRIAKSPGVSETTTMIIMDS